MKQNRPTLPVLCSSHSSCSLPSSSSSSSPLFGSVMTGPIIRVSCCQSRSCPTSLEGPSVEHPPGSREHPPGASAGSIRREHSPGASAGRARGQSVLIGSFQHLLPHLAPSNQWQRRIFHQHRSGNRFGNDPGIERKKERKREREKERER